MIEVPPALWLPSRPAIVRAHETPESALRKCGFMPGFRRPSSVTPASVSYIGITHDTSNSTTYTFTSVAIGTAAADRYVFVAVTSATSAGAGRTISSATIGGVAATIHTNAGVVSTSGLSASIISALVPTGTTGTIAITLNGAGGSLDIGVFRVTGLGSATPFATASGSSATGTGIATTTVNVPAGGFLIACANFEIDSATTTWVGINESYDETNTDSSPEIVTGGFIASLGAETGRTVSATSSSNGGSTNDCVMTVASWA